MLDVYASTISNHQQFSLSLTKSEINVVTAKPIITHPHLQLYVGLPRFHKTFLNG